MRAVRFARYGGPDVLECADVPRPDPAPHELLVRVRAASLNPLDWRMRAGKLRLFLRVPLPFTLGYDCAGVVEQAGAGVDRFRAGDEIYAFVDYERAGCHADFAVVPEADAAPKPAEMSFVEAAAVPLAGLTALQGMRNVCGTHALVIGASGGVGHYAVQVGKALGAEVTAVCGTDHVEMVRGLGADRVIDYRREDFREVGGSYDLVFDVVAKHSYGACRHLMRERAHYVTTLPTVGVLLRMAFLRFHSRRRARYMTVRPDADGLGFLAELTHEGKLRSVVSRVFRLEDAAAAHEEGETGHVTGKLVFEMEE